MQDIQLEDAAGDLDLPPAELLRNVDLLNPVLTVLKKGTLDRDDFTALYVDSLCRLSGPLNNQPLPAVCDAAAAAAARNAASCRRPAVPGGGGPACPLPATSRAGHSQDRA
ncbi:MAG TPA: hypothetical protein VFS67_31690 [Polyangiaceae bacterium]|jgi:hypothetical protein|nr:hypothetical protein [Polyangiaceae bacterium]